MICSRASPRTISSDSKVFGASASDCVASAGLWAVAIATSVATSSRSKSAMP
jgi:hypothetical protein